MNSLWQTFAVTYSLVSLYLAGAEYEILRINVSSLMQTYKEGLPKRCHVYSECKSNYNYAMFQPFGRIVTLNEEGNGKRFLRSNY